MTAPDLHFGWSSQEDPVNVTRCPGKPTGGAAMRTLYDQLRAAASVSAWCVANDDELDGEVIEARRPSRIKGGMRN